MENNQTNSAYGNEQLRRRSLVSEIRRRDSREAAKLLMGDAIERLRNVLKTPFA